MTTMLYKSPGDVKRRDGTSFCWQIVDDADVEAALDAGWFSHPNEAIAAAAGLQEHEPEDKPKRGRPRKSEAE
jgi:hypothetical protein